MEVIKFSKTEFVKLEDVKYSKVAVIFDGFYFEKSKKEPAEVIDFNNEVSE